MKITKVGVEYRELRSTGYPNFSNVTHGVTLEAEVGLEEQPVKVRAYLRTVAIQEVKTLFGDPGEVRSDAEVRVSKDALDALVSVAEDIDNSVGYWASDDLQEKARQLGQRARDIMEPIPF